MSKSLETSTSRVTDALPDRRNPAPRSAVPGSEGTRVALLAFWLFFAAMWSLSFVTQHEWNFSINAAQATAEDIAKDVAEGSILRRVALPLMAVVSLMAVYLRRERLCWPNFSGCMLLALFVWMAVSVMWSDQPELSARRLVGFGCLLISALGTAVVAYGRLPTFMAAFSLCNLIMGILAEFTLGSLLLGTAGYRFGGTIHPNLQGINLVLLIVSLVWMAFISDRRGIIVVLGGIAFVFLLLTHSRTSLGALTAALAFSFSIMAARKWGAPLFLPAAAVTGCVFGSLLLFDFFTWNVSLADLAVQIISAERDLGDPTQLTGRVDIWLELLKFIEQRPWLGWGFDAFWSPDRIYEISWNLQWQINHAHNAYLDILANLGIVGLTFYVLSLAVAQIASTKYFLCGSDASGFSSAIIVVVMFHGALESISILPTFLTFALFTVLFRLAFLREVISNERG